jgi:hypothetical protein
MRALEAFKRRKKALELEEWQRLPTTGKSVMSFADDPIENAWLFNPKLLKSSRFISALGLRSGTKPTVTMNTVIEQPTIRSRKCDSTTETMPHILGQCTFTKKKRIRRHDDIKNLVAERISSDPKVQVLKEGSFETQIGTLNSDLVIIDGGRVHVVDVTVRHEGVGYLQKGHQGKINRTSGRAIPSTDCNGNERENAPNTISSLRDLGITNSNSHINMAMVSLRRSTEIYHSFLDYDALLV